MKTIKIDFAGFWSDFDKENNLFINALREKYDVKISDNPDFVIVSVLGKPFEYLKYDCVRILFSGEPFSADFNIFDYAITFDHASFNDAEGFNRHYRFPLCLYNIERIVKKSCGMSRSEAEEALAKKKYFCNFIYGHKSSLGKREEMFDVFSKYKRVESAGSFMNNMPDAKVIPYSEKKMDFLKLCKFTISCESVSYPGFITEKVINPIYSDSIPIYYGSSSSLNEFNSNAIINCHNYSSFEEVLERVKEIDGDDELYIKMLMEPKFISDDYLEKMYSGLKEWLWHIFSYDNDSAYRRCRFYIAKEHEQHLKAYNKFFSSPWRKVFSKLVK